MGTVDSWMLKVTIDKCSMGLTEITPLNKKNGCEFKFSIYDVSTRHRCSVNGYLNQIG